MMVARPAQDQIPAIQTVVGMQARAKEEAGGAAPRVYAKTTNAGETPGTHRWAARNGLVSIVHSLAQLRVPPRVAQANASV